MLRTSLLASAWWMIVCANCFVLAQEPATPRKSSRVKLPKTFEKISPELRGAIVREREAIRESLEHSPSVTERVRDAAKARAKRATSEAAPTLAELGASAPFDYSARNRYLVAATQGDQGLALWETGSRKRLRELEDSKRPYALVAISDDARWIAGVRKQEDDQIDLWRADNGRRVRVIQTAAGAKSKIAFESNSQLHVVDANGKGIVIGIPSGVAVGGSSTRQGGSAVRRPTLSLEAAPQATMPLAPSTTRMAPPSLSRDLESPSMAQPAPRAEMRREPRIPEVPLPSMAPPPSPKAMSRSAPRATVSAPPAMAAPMAAPELPSFESAPHDFAAPAADAPSSPAPEEFFSPPPTESFSAPSEPAGGAAPSMAAPEEPAAASPAVDEPAQPFHFELGEEPAAEAILAPGSAAPAEAEEPADETVDEAAPSVPEPRAEAAAAPAQSTVAEPTPTSINIHYATNRNRLAPKDRQWLVYFLGFFGSLPAFVIYALSHSGAVDFSLVRQTIVGWCRSISRRAGSVLDGLRRSLRPLSTARRNVGRVVRLPSHRPFLWKLRDLGAAARESPPGRSEPPGFGVDFRGAGKPRETLHAPARRGAQG